MYGIKDKKKVDAAVEMYKNGATMREVSAAMHMAPATVSNIVREHGLTRGRGKRLASSVATFDRTCPACGNTKHLIGATYCMDCGSLLASRHDLAADAAERVAKFIAEYSSVIDGSGNVIRDMSIVTSYLREESSNA